MNCGFDSTGLPSLHLCYNTIPIKGYMVFTKSSEAPLRSVKTKVKISIFIEKTANNLVVQMFDSLLAHLINL